MNDKIIDLAKKLKALSDKGIDGEKDTALTMLKRLMGKYNLTMDMIEENLAKEYEFYIEYANYKFWRQVVASVIGSSDVSYRPSELKKKKRHYFVLCTPAEAIEIQAKFDFYFKAWQTDLDIYYQAFVQKNHLYTKPDKQREKEEKELTDEEFKKLWKMSELMKGMDKHNFLKQLTI